MDKHWIRIINKIENSLGYKIINHFQEFSMQQNKKTIPTKKRTCLGLECNKEVEDKWFCKECAKKNKRIKVKNSNKRIGGSGHYYRSE